MVKSLKTCFQQSCVVVFKYLTGNIKTFRTLVKRELLFKVSDILPSLTNYNHNLELSLKIVFVFLCKLKKVFDRIFPSYT